MRVLHGSSRLQKRYQLWQPRCFPYRLSWNSVLSDDSVPHLSTPVCPHSPGGKAIIELSIEEIFSYRESWLTCDNWIEYNKILIQYWLLFSNECIEISPLL